MALTSSTGTPSSFATASMADLTWISSSVVGTLPFWKCKKVNAAHKSAGFSIAGCGFRANHFFGHFRR